ncbi:hypothetical protein LIER_37452 [Lithospermum erythrorhizon]|uniref:Uncharacterized protein n=1 Tax=Lithospermum erythrorhizon TaxID=34254 RepID=A0AAV3PPV6_LITER
MDFLKQASSKLQAGADDEGKVAEPKKDDQQTPSTTELMSSAKVVADAAKAKMSNQEFDQHKAAEAAADVLDGASHYGKLDESQGLGKMVNQAEDYLHKYSTTTTTTTTGHGGDGQQPPTTTTTTTASTHETSGGGGADEGGEEKSDIMKMAEGFLK